MKDSFLLFWRGYIRSGFLWLLLAAIAAVYRFAPELIRSDGTLKGAFEMWARASVGGTFTVIAISLLVSACGAFAIERSKCRLALSTVRPTSAVSFVLGVWFAHLLVAAIALVFSCSIAFWIMPSGCETCRHRYRPIMLSEAETAAGMLEAYLADPKTPEAVKKAPRKTVLRILTNREKDRYEVIKKGESIAWKFSPELVSAKDVAAEVKFSTAFDMRASVLGTFAFAGGETMVSNNTQSITVAPLAMPSVEKVKSAGENATLALVFKNTGRNSVMARPRRDVEITSRADGVRSNCARAHLEMFLVIALLTAFGIFLSASLSRPVALFTALTALAITLMSPSVVDQYPDELTATLADRMGLVISRAAAFVTSGVSGVSPVSDFACGTCVEWCNIATTAISDTVVIPCLLLLLTGFIIRRKNDERN